MRILITNDDGIDAPGLSVLAAIADEIAGTDGEVWCVAPAFEQSGVAHCIGYTHPTMIVQLSERRFAAEGSPADCVLAAIHDTMTAAPPDLILSGVNRGNNAAENTLYSGTIGAAIEGALQGVRSIALSQYYGPGNATLDDPFEAARVHGAAVVRRILDHGAWDEDHDYRLFYNVNFPPCPATEVAGLSVGTQGFRGIGRMGVEPVTSPSGRRFLWVRGGAQDVVTADGSDAAANLRGHVSVTPMRADLTAHERVAALRSALDGPLA